MPELASGVAILYSLSVNSWPHAPARLASHSGATIVTASTYHQLHLFNGPARLELLEAAIFIYCEALNWQLQAWAVFPNHYHFIAMAPGDDSLGKLIHRIHASTAHQINREDHC